MFLLLPLLQLPLPTPSLSALPSSLQSTGNLFRAGGSQQLRWPGPLPAPSRVSRPQRPWCPQSGMLMIRDEPMAAQLVLSFHIHRRKTTLGHLPHPQAQEGTVGQPPHVHRRRRALWGQPGSTSWGQSVLLQGPRWQGAEAEHCPHWDSGTHRRWEEGGLD